MCFTRKKRVRNTTYLLLTVGGVVCYLQHRLTNKHFLIYFYKYVLYSQKACKEQHNLFTFNRWRCSMLPSTQDVHNRPTNKHFIIYFHKYVLYSQKACKEHNLLTFNRWWCSMLPPTQDVHNRPNTGCTQQAD